MNRVLVLLATYNGSKYIRQMVDSVLTQDYDDVHLVLSDDGSTDNTVEILEEYARNYPDRVIHYRSGLRFGNAQNHFMHLLQRFHNAPYIMFCDQDDIWHSDKIRKTMDKMLQTETSPEIPSLVHTDLNVVDAQCNCIHPSFTRFSGISGDRLTTKALLVQNVVTGCTMMLNQKLAVLAAENLPVGHIAMHDWWIALLAATCGTISYLDESTIDYRQHENNSVGAKNAHSLAQILSKLRNNKIQMRMQKSFCQAEAFAACFGEILPPEEAALIHAYSKLKEANWLQRKFAYMKYGFWMDGFLKQLGQFLLG